jgi:preflagellin peptidase FlaK
VKTREIDVGILAAGGAAAAVLMRLNWGNPLYTLSLAVGALLALLTRLSGAGYADSTALALISTAPPVAFLPAPLAAVAAGSALLPATMLRLYAKNRGRRADPRGLSLTLPDYVFHHRYVVATYL